MRNKTTAPPEFRTVMVTQALGLVVDVDSGEKPVSIKAPDDRGHILPATIGTGRTLDDEVIAAAGVGQIALRKVIKALVRARVLRKQMLRGQKRIIQNRRGKVEDGSQGNQPVVVDDVKLIAADAENAARRARDSQIICRSGIGIERQTEISMQRIDGRGGGDQMTRPVVNREIGGQQ